MIKNYLTLTIRNLRKRKIYSCINIVGLAIGLAVCLVIWRFVEFELSYDNFHSKADNIYRTTFTEYGKNWKDDWFVEFGYGLGPALINEIPEIKNFARIHPLYGEASLISVIHDGCKINQFYEENIFFADSTFLDMFSYPVIAGNASVALDDPSSIVITEATAKRYFGDVDPIGKSLNLKNNYWGEGEYTVTAIMKNIPENSHLKFDILISMHNLLQIEYYQDPDAAWSANNFVTYVEMEANTKPQFLEEKTKRFMDTHTGTEPLGVKLSYQPLRTTNLSPDLNNSNGYLNTLYFFVLISFLILCIAWINYINLATARAAERAKEVGIKKAIGVLRHQLITQFTLEAFFINLISVMLACSMAVALLPVLNGIVGKNIDFDFSSSSLWIILSLSFVFGSLVTGAYPALALSSFKPVDVIKGVAKTGRGLVLRKTLVVFQFTASLLLMAGTFIILRQVNFMLERDKGFNMHQMLIVNGPQFTDSDSGNPRLISFKDELSKIRSVENITTSGAIPGGGFSFTTGMHIKGKENSNAIREAIHVVLVDADFIDTYRMSLVSGEIWKRFTDYNMNSVLINEAALERFDLGTAEQALDEILIIDQQPFRVQGVLKNFHWNSPKSPYLPMVFRLQKANSNLISIQLSSDIHTSVAKVEQIYKKFFPADPFSYYFLDDFFNRQYQEENQSARLFTMFSILAIVIACLGLGGLASFTTTQRVKEISIRKVLGASVNNIVTLLSAQFLKLLLLSSLIAMPVIWIAGNSWIDNFAFKVPMTAEVFAFPLLAFTIIAIGTVSVHIFRGASANPAEVLRSEG